MFILDAYIHVFIHKKMYLLINLYLICPKHVTEIGSDGYNDWVYNLSVFYDLPPLNSVVTILFNDAGMYDTYDSVVLDYISNAEAIWFAGGDQVGSLSVSVLILVVIGGYCGYGGGSSTSSATSMLPILVLLMII